METDNQKNNQIDESQKPVVMKITAEKSKHNNMLVVLMILLFLIIAAFGGLTVYQMQDRSKETADTKNTPTGQSATDKETAASESLDSPVTSNIDNEISTLDSSIGSQSDADFSGSSLSDSEIGLK